VEKIIAIDYGLKRTGIAYAEEPLFIAHPLTTLKSEDLLDFLKKINSENRIKKIIIGEPKSLDGTPTDATFLVQKLKDRIVAELSSIEIIFHDERFTSKIAKQSMILSGVKKKDRRVKGNVDKIAAVIILQDYLAFNSL
jgi:putative Holliday junction resolvase|tara:strand:- start:316 stop:732 length:417 start_codon:yes stop_codon:yes gene_type:complete